MAHSTTETPTAGDWLDFGHVKRHISRVVKLDNGLLQVHFDTNVGQRLVGGGPVIHLRPEPVEARAT